MSRADDVPYSTITASENMQIMGMMVLEKFSNPVILISYDFPISLSIFCLLTFSLFKTIKIILSSQTEEKQVVARLGLWSVACSRV